MLLSVTSTDWKERITMKTINEISDDELVFNSDELIYGYELKEKWNSLKPSQRRNWYTTSRRRISISAREVLSSIYEDIDSEGYEDMEARLWNETTDDLIEKLQNVLDEISEFASAVVYDVSEPISSVHALVDEDHKKWLVDYLLKKAEEKVKERGRQ